MRMCLPLFVGATLFLAGGATAQAQYPYQRPGVTPYLNLYRGGASPALNYLNLVKPELDSRGAIQQLQQQSLANQNAISDMQSGPNSQALVTGHVAGFMTQGTYFQTIKASGVSGGAGGSGMAKSGGGFQAPTGGGQQATSGVQKPSIR